MQEQGRAWLVRAQNADGGWGGDAGVPSTVEETGVAVAALAAGAADYRNTEILQRGTAWLLAQTAEPAAVPASPCGLYFSSLWYAEHLYPRLFALEALARLADGVYRGGLGNPAASANASRSRYS
jgi:squalene-hopene/tetraprenyl-beta-curcumene cyclase